ncbi:MAG: MGMT family protein, partial [Deltaproteobacteria bacterium]|nr:MGMT family protein [Deltaproteobacteria bacterium]
MKRKRGEVTEFQNRVYAAARKIPRGKVTTYKYLARAIGCGSSRAVGQALRVNPFAPEVPCHRVIRSDLTIGGFSGQVEGPSIEEKKALLAREGVRFDGDRLSRREDVYR